MSSTSTSLSTFSSDRVYPVSPAELFSAFSQADRKRRWFVEGEGWQIDEFVVDFRPGGSERSSFRFEGGASFSNDTTYLDIVPDRRIVFAYAMATEGKPFSASLATIEFVPEGEGTRLVYSEQAAYLDSDNADAQTADRKAGWAELLEALARHLDETAG
ncbi:hypothetical protein CO731_02037 [Aminobacter sp. MSH1]|uniref:SRPBCC family protein n=1 Tax=Aminobacter sp. MSH1 TaxID=374606 RepID=UPI000D388B38|nr:SRPBCC family protein [Aminobacter sp. MSH1]AWC22573.1 hypothetical protein CO731_02037 [Aminobacter sp. MSH1]